MMGGYAMVTDLFGKKRYKVNLHTHTTDTDGQRTQKEVIARYRAEGYDAIAVTDHWVSKFTCEEDGMVLLAGGEYNLGYRDSLEGVYHILGIGFEEAPKGIWMNDPPQKVIDEIHRVGGIAILGHPAWSLNTPEQIRALHGIDATEI
jgi:predicted metal-dependent phosphoesterase TrpH